MHLVHQLSSFPCHTDSLIAAHKEIHKHKKTNILLSVFKHTAVNGEERRCVDIVLNKWRLSV